jgi:hypothetical protein
MRGIGIAGVAALVVAVPVAALAGGAEKPTAGAWVPYESTQSDDVAQGNFTVTSGGGGVSAMTFAVTSESGENPGCPTGSVSVPGPLEVRYYKFKHSRPFWGFGQIVNKHYKGEGVVKVFDDAAVTATLDGQPVKGAKLSIQFVPANTEGITGDISGGEFDFSAKCQVTLSEDISQSENARRS